jgi:flavin reductase
MPELSGRTTTWSNWPGCSDRNAATLRTPSPSGVRTRHVRRSGPASEGKETPVDRGAFLAAMRKAVMTVGIVATDGPGGRCGLTVSSLSSLTLDPPAMLVCISRCSPLLSAVARNRSFCINLLGEGDEQVSDVFAGRHPAANADRFAHAGWTTLVTGSPALLSAAASLDCRTAAQYRFGSHVLLIGKVVGVQINEARVLLYHDRQYCRLGEGCN